jgi:hypothetical protein
MVSMSLFSLDPLDGDEKVLGDGVDGIHDHIKLSTQPWREDGVESKPKGKCILIRVFLFLTKVQ